MSEQIASVLEFVKGWLPSIGVIVGALWVFFGWLHDYRRKQKKEMPALSGEVTLQFNDLTDDKVLVSIYSNWTNSSPMPIQIDQKETRVDIFEIDNDVEFGPLVLKSDLGEPRYQNYPLSDMNGFVFEPSSNNQIRSQFVLECGKMFGARIKIYRDRNTHGAIVFSWTRECVFDTHSLADGATKLNNCGKPLPN